MKMRGTRAFTILELLIVIGIMGLLGTVSVSGFRGLRKGMEERGAMQVVDEFIRSAYRRAVIDRVPVHVYFWNETVSDETSDASATKKLVVVGHAVAVRRAGRVSKIADNFLVDEFGDLANEVYADEDGKKSVAGPYADDPGRYLYRMKTDGFERSVVSSFAVNMDHVNPQKDHLISHPDQQVAFKAYGYYVKPDASGQKVYGIGQWHVGDPYGFEIAALTLPKNFIFGSKNDCSKDVKDPERAVNNVMVITGAGQITNPRTPVCGLRLDSKGEVDFKEIGRSRDPKEDR